MRENFKVGDYVKYIGDQTTLQPIIRNEDYAKIVSLEERNGYLVCSLYLLTSKTNLTCFADKIRDIATEPKHFKKLGFEEVQKSFFVNGSVIISNIYIYFQNENLHFFTGYRLADFRHFDSEYLKKFSVDDKFDANLFDSEFLSLHNINDLLDLMESKGFNVDKESIICC